jgi:hypothetical protein
MRNPMRCSTKSLVRAAASGDCGGEVQGRGPGAAMTSDGGEGGCQRGPSAGTTASGGGQAGAGGGARGSHEIPTRTQHACAGYPTRPNPQALKTRYHLPPISPYQHQALNNPFPPAPLAGLYFLSSPWPINLIKTGTTME